MLSASAIKQVGRASAGAASATANASSSAHALMAAQSTAAAAQVLRTLASAGFDTPTTLPPNTITQTQTSNNATCPIANTSAGSSSVPFLAPSIFASSRPSSGRCPCGLYTLTTAPTNCTWAATARQQQQQLQHGAETAGLYGKGVSIQRKHVLLSSTGMSAARPAIRTFTSLASQLTSEETNDAAVEGQENDARTQLKETSTKNEDAPVQSSSSSSPSTSEPRNPPPVSLPPSLSSAHSSLLALEEYRTSVQAILRLSSGHASSASSAKQSLERTLSIVGVIPGSGAMMKLQVLRLQAFIAGWEGKHSEERRIRADIIRELERMFVAPSKRTGSSGGNSISPLKPSLKDADLLLLIQDLNAYALAAWKDGAKNDVRNVCETWIARFEDMLLSGSRPPSPTGQGQQHATSSPSQPTSHHASRSRPPEPPFSTGATAKRLLSGYLSLMQVLIASQAPSLIRAVNDTPEKEVRERLTQLIDNLAQYMTGRPHMAARSEWKLFQGELMLLPQHVMEWIDLRPLLPAAAWVEQPEVESSDEPKPSQQELIQWPVPADLLSRPLPPTSSPSPMPIRAVSYFNALTSLHPSSHELQRVALSETNLVRQWYSSRLEAHLVAAQMLLQERTSRDESLKLENNENEQPQSDATASSNSTSPNPSTLLSSCLQLIESRLSSDPSNPYLLRTLLLLGVDSHSRHMEPDGIESEGLLRNVLGKLEAMGPASTSSPSMSGCAAVLAADPTLFPLYVDAVLEYVYLLTQLSWNNRSRRSEARLVMFQRLLQPAQKNVAAHKALLEALPHARRLLDLSKVEWSALNSADDINDEMMRLATNTTSNPIATWMQMKLHLGHGCP